MNTGHRGTLATIHASSAEEAVHRLATLAMRASGALGITAVEAEIERCLDLIVYISRRDGRRVVEGLLHVGNRRTKRRHKAVAVMDDLRFAYTAEACKLSQCSCSTANSPPSAR